MGMTKASPCAGSRFECIRFRHAGGMARCALRFLFVSILLAAASVVSAMPTSAPMSGGLEIQAFYQMRQGMPAWSGNAAAQTNAKLALAVLAGATGEGLDPERYRVPTEPAGYDAALTGAVLTYMRDLQQGRPELRSV